MSLGTVQAHILTELQGLGYTVETWVGQTDVRLNFTKNGKRYICELKEQTDQAFIIILRTLSSSMPPFIFKCPIDSKELIRVGNILRLKIQ